jgi:hypothetical protein
MADFGGLIRNAARRAGRTVGRVGKELSGGRIEGSLPQDESGQVRIVCRRHAEKRALSLEAGNPSCYEAGNADCESCVEDISDGTVETW